MNRGSAKRAGTGTRVLAGYPKSLRACCVPVIRPYPSALGVERVVLI